MTYNCPSCGAEVVFRSRFGVFSVCSYCQTMVVRHDVDIENLGKMAELPPDMSPFQLGTRGKYKNVSFELIGRIKMGWENGSWNEWYAFFENDKEGFLAEAQGFYMISFLHDNAAALPPFRNIQIGQQVSLKQEIYSVIDIKEATCIGSVGELPFASPHGRKSTIVDLSGPNNLFASVDYAGDEKILYLGEYISFNDGHFTQLRELDGW